MRKGLIVTLVVVSLVVVAVVLSVVIRPKAVPPKTVGLEKRTIQESVTAVGSIVPKHIITVRSALDGIVTKMYKDIGFWLVVTIGSFCILEAIWSLFETNGELVPLDPYKRSRKIRRLRRLHRRRRMNAEHNKIWSKHQ